MTWMTDPAAMRRGYLHGRLDDPDQGVTSRTWLEQFRLWFDDASADPAVLEANAMQVATAGPDGRPSVRTVLLKGLDERGVVFFTNYDSAKGRDLAVNPFASAVFAWLAHERQVRLSGPVDRVSLAETQAYFAGRPRGSQLGAWASPQSEIVLSRKELELAYGEVETRFAGEDVPPPPNWGGYRIAPNAVEFWQGRPDRLHDRLRYRHEGERWVIERLAP
ncbi:MAG TPA: pyridoxamine 5'-phosphate oxidase [Jatrophihabitantaceae bacterium]|nr:pyridoxamine 5'-phosphate oxidase [Jatrophihabitantaceae bacterium]